MTTTVLQSYPHLQAPVAMECKKKDFFFFLLRVFILLFSSSFLQRILQLVPLIICVES